MQLKELVGMRVLQVTDQCGVIRILFDDEACSSLLIHRTKNNLVSLEREEQVITHHRKVYYP